MALLSKPTSGAAVAVGYITIGALLDVWAGIWYVYLRNNQPEGTLQYYFCAGFFFSGLVLVILGLTLGQIGRAARKAELPPSEATAAVARTDIDAANHPAQIMQVAPQPVVPNGPVATNPTVAPQAPVPIYAPSPAPRAMTGVPQG